MINEDARYRRWLRWCDPARICEPSQPSCDRAAADNRIMAKEVVNQVKTLTLEGFGKMPAMEFRLREDGQVEWRYLIGQGDYPGFDSYWRVMSEVEKRETLRMGGRIAQWLISLEEMRIERSLHD